MKNNLYIIRRQKGITQAQMAKRVKVSRAQMSRIETGVTKMDEAFIKTLCAAYGITREEMFETTLVSQINKVKVPAPEKDAIDRESFSIIIQTINSSVAIESSPGAGGLYMLCYEAFLYAKSIAEEAGGDPPDQEMITLKILKVIGAVVDKNY